MSPVFGSLIVPSSLSCKCANWKDKDGVIYVGGPGGITRFNPKSVKADYSSHDPVIIGIKSYERHLNELPELHVSSQSIHEDNKLVVEANRRKLAFDFTTPEYIFTRVFLSGYY